MGFLKFILAVGAIGSVIAFFLALTAEASVGWNYPFAFHFAVWTALLASICIGGLLLLH